MAQPENLSEKAKGMAGHYGRFGAPLSMSGAEAGAITQQSVIWYT
jgi:hypothetical protein